MNLELMLHMKPTNLYAQNILAYVSKLMVPQVFLVFFLQDSNTKTFSLEIHLH